MHTKVQFAKITIISNPVYAHWMETWAFKYTFSCNKLLHFQKTISFLGVTTDFSRAVVEVELEVTQRLTASFNFKQEVSETLD